MNPYTSTDLLINNLSKEERLALKESLLNTVVKIMVIDKYGFFTEHGFPVALATYHKFDRSNMQKEFYAKVVSIDPMVTIYELPEA